MFTDNNPLTYVMTSAKLNATGMRWVSELADYEFTIKYRPGKKGRDADGLSRNPSTIEELERVCTGICDPERMAAVMSVPEVNLCQAVSIDQLEFIVPETP